MSNADEMPQNLTQPTRVVVGADGVFAPGWLPTDKDFLNLLEPDDWRRLFPSKSIDAILAEHVWEHLTVEEALTAARTCFEYLRPGGYLRVAVPDGLHPDPNYLEQVKPGGAGSGADDHKTIYTYKTFRELFERVGFLVNMLEYFDEAGEFFFKAWEPADGMIHRSIRYDRRNRDGIPHYTSIILDARKPIIISVEPAKLNILAPLSSNWGWDRGGSIDRYYIDAFVMTALKGRCGRFLEFGSPTYKRFVEPGNIERYDILDIDPYNPEATIVGDVQTLATNFDGVFDVIICTQVLQLVERPEVAVGRMRELLKPTGLMILSVPFISKEHEPSSDHWRFGRKAVEELLAPFSLKEVTVAGNLFSSVCFLLGLGVGDVRQADLDPTDTQHYTVVLATATK